MENILVRRDQFNITPTGIVHKPTDASFTPYPGEAYCGITRMGQLGNHHPSGGGFKPDDVQRMMRQLWIEYVVGKEHHTQLFDLNTDPDELNNLADNKDDGGVLTRLREQLIKLAKSFNDPDAAIFRDAIAGKKKHSGS